MCIISYYTPVKQPTYEKSVYKNNKVTGTATVHEFLGTH